MGVFDDFVEVVSDGIQSLDAAWYRELVEPHTFDAPSDTSPVAEGVSTASVTQDATILTDGAHVDQYDETDATSREGQLVDPADDVSETFDARETDSFVFTETAPEWTDSSDHDPGVSLLDASWYRELGDVFEPDPPRTYDAPADTSPVVEGVSAVTSSDQATTLADASPHASISWLF